MLFKEGTFVKFHDYPHRVWVVLEVTQEIFDNTSVDVAEPGFYAFGGMWYGDDPMSIDSFGKVLPLDDFDFVIVDPSEVTTEQLKN